MKLPRNGRTSDLLRRLVLLCLALAVGGLIAPGPRAGSAPVGADTSRPLGTPAWDDETTIRNPGTGWMVYAEEFVQPLADAGKFWAAVDPYIADASILYLRVPWSRLEPTEGRFAWNGDDNYRSLVAGARERGLRLAFRVYIDSQDSHQQATPRFVFDAGAAGYATSSNPALRNPAVDDPVFREKFDAFLAAFGAQYDDPAVVDFVDVNTIGWWGEMHSIPGLDHETWTDTVRWLGSG